MSVSGDGLCLRRGQNRSESNGHGGVRLVRVHGTGRDFDAEKFACLHHATQDFKVGYRHCPPRGGPSRGTFTQTKGLHS